MIDLGDRATEPQGRAVSPDAEAMQSRWRVALWVIEHAPRLPAPWPRLDLQRRTGWGYAYLTIWVGRTGRVVPVRALRE